VARRVIWCAAPTPPPARCRTDSDVAQPGQFHLVVENVRILVICKQQTHNGNSQRKECWRVSLIYELSHFFVLITLITDFHRSKTALITSQTLKNRKPRIRNEPGMERPSLTPVNIQTFNPMSLKEGYMVNSAPLKFKRITDLESVFAIRPREGQVLDSASVITLKDPRGVSVSLDNFDEILLQVNLGKRDMSRRIPRSLYIAMVEIEGGPDLYVCAERGSHESGMQSEKQKIWHSKQGVVVHPDDSDCVSGKYFVKILSGIDKCRCRVIAETRLYTPMIDNALLGPGCGFRPSSAQKKIDFGNLVISTALGSANRRRLLGKLGCNPFDGSEVSISNMRRAHSCQSEALPNDGAKSRPQSALGLSGAVSDLEPDEQQEGDKSTMKHALEISCRSSLERVRFGKTTPIRDVARPLLFVMSLFEISFPS
jgi:hypothetical protein